MRPWRVAGGGGRLMVYYGLLPRAARVQCAAVWHNTGGLHLGFWGTKMVPFFGQLVENNDYKYAFRKPFQNFGKIRIFV